MEIKHVMIPNMKIHEAHSHLPKEMIIADFVPAIGTNIRTFILPNMLFKIVDAKVQISILGDDVTKDFIRKRFGDEAAIFDRLINDGEIKLTK